MERNSRRKKFTELLILFALCFLPLMVLAGCGMTDSFSCKMCGSPDTKTPIYASGEVKQETEKYDRTITYQSCVGPAGCIGLGFNTSCLPTECQFVSMTGDEITGHSDEDKYEMSGIIYYYNGFGCIKPDTAKTLAVYHKSFDCMGLGCMPICGGVYKEETYGGEEVRAYSADGNCGSCTMGDEPSDSLDLNEGIPRQFTYGCTSACHDD